MAGLVVLASTAGAGTVAPRELRVFAVAYRHHPDRVTSYEAFRSSLEALFDAHIVPHLRADAPNLVTLPENLTLMAYFLGSRGAASRALLAAGDSTAAVAALAGPYAPQIAYYEARFPGVDSPGQLLQLALTDTLVRAAVETGAALARRYGVWLAVGTNLADFRRVEGPTAALLADPEADDPSYAYEATAPEVWNRNLIFDPDGELVAVQDKAFLVPIERARDVGLGLASIETAEVPVADIAGVRVGTVISKDAWMPPVNDRLDQLGAELLVQPEAFSTWGLAGEDLWPPDKFQRGGWWMVQKLPAVRANVTPMLTGNFGDLTFDGQPLVAVDGPAGDPTLCLMGQQPSFGWAAVGRWDDRDARTMCDPALRGELAAHAARLAPGSGDPAENAYAEDVVWADLTLPPPPPTLPRIAGDPPPSRSLGPGLLPAVAAGPAGAWVAWVDTSQPDTAQVVAAATDGHTVGDPEPVDPQPVRPYDHFDDQWAPTVAVGPEGPVVAYLGFPTENWDVFAARRTTDGWRAVRVDDADPDPGVLRERGHSSPRLVTDGGTLVAVWSDLRWPWVLPQVRLARSTDGGASWSASRRIDGGPVTGEAAQLDAPPAGGTRGQAYPAPVVVPGGVGVAWQEATADGTPAVWWAVEGDPPTLLWSGPAWRPAAAAEGTTVWVVAEVDDGAGGTHLEVRVSSDGGRRFGPPVPVAPVAPGVVQRTAAPVPLGDGTVLVVWEDQRAGDGDVLAAVVDDRGRSGPVSRVDDGPPGSHARAPAAARLPSGPVLLAWQDTRSGGEEIRTALLTSPPPAPVEPPPALPATGAGLAGLAVLLAAAAVSRAPRRR